MWDFWEFYLGLWVPGNSVHDGFFLAVELGRRLARAWPASWRYENERQPRFLFVLRGPEVVASTSERRINTWSTVWVLLVFPSFSRECFFACPLFRLTPMSLRAFLVTAVPDICPQKAEVRAVRACRASLEQAQQELQATSKIVLEMRNILQRHGFTDVSRAMFLYSSVPCCLLPVACVHRLIRSWSYCCPWGCTRWELFALVVRFRQWWW